MKKSWNCEQCEKKFPLKYGYDRRMKVHKATTTDVENLVKKVKSKAGFGTFVREKNVKVADNTCVVNAIKHLIRPSA